MRRLVTLALCALGLGSIAGCLELSQSYTLNPDGSGKVVIDSITPAGGGGFGGAPAPADPKETVKKALNEQIGKAKGVDAWSDVSCELEKDGRVHFKGTAYFPDVNKLAIDGEKNAVSFVKEGDAMVLKFDTDKGEPGGEAPKLTEAEITEKIKQERAQYEQGKAMVSAMFKDLKFQMSFALPGTVAESNILKKEGNTVSMAITGPQIIAAMDKMNADDALMRKKVMAAPGDDSAMNELIFGGKGEPSAKVTGAAASQFDYKAESGKAKAAQAEMFKKLGVEAPAN